MGKHVRPKNEAFTISFESTRNDTAIDEEEIADNVSSSEGEVLEESSSEIYTSKNLQDGDVPNDNAVWNEQPYRYEQVYMPVQDTLYAQEGEYLIGNGYVGAEGYYQDPQYNQSEEYLLNDGQPMNFEASQIEFKATPKTDDSKNEPRFIKEAKRRRRRLTLIIIALVIVVLGLLAGGAFMFMQTQQNASNTAKSSTEAQLSANTDSKTTSNMKVEVPNIVQYIETNLNYVLDNIGHGAQLAATYEIDTKEAKYHTEQTIDLTADAKDDKYGYPQVFLSYNWSGSLIRTGYSATISQLGYGVISIDELVNNQHAVEKTLKGAGFNVEEGTVVLPTDKSSYQTYDANGKLSRELVDFTGKASTTTGKTYTWEAAVMYDYTTSNATGNLADTLRQIYVYCLEY